MSTRLKKIKPHLHPSYSIYSDSEESSSSSSYSTETLVKEILAETDLTKKYVYSPNSPRYEPTPSPSPEVTFVKASSLLNMANLNAFRDSDDEVLNLQLTSTLFFTLSLRNFSRATSSSRNSNAPQRRQRAPIPSLANS